MILPAKNILIFLYLLLCMSVTNAQTVIDSTYNSKCIGTDKIKWGGGYGDTEYIWNCPTYSFAYGGDTSKNWNALNNAIDIKQAPQKVIELKNKIDHIIRAYAGSSFYALVEFISVDVVYPDRLQALTDSGRTGLTLEHCKAKYLFNYQFGPDTAKTYIFSVAVNKYGKIISPFPFPPKRYYKPVDKTFTYCRLIAIARKVQKKIDPIDEISLQYNKKSKRFYWLVAQAIPDDHEGLVHNNEVMIDAADLSKVKKTQGEADVIY